MANTYRHLFTEAHEGVVKYVGDNGIIVLYEIDDELVEHTYTREQLGSGPLPEVGTNIRTSTIVGTIYKKPDAPCASKSEQAPRGYDTGPLAV